MTVIVVVCLVAGGSLLVAWSRARAFSLERRVEGARAAGVRGGGGVVARIVRPLVDDAVAGAARLGGAVRLEARLAGAGGAGGEARHRALQVAGALVGAGAASAVVVAIGALRGVAPVLMLVVVALAAAVGAAVPGMVLARRVAARSARMRAELPAVAELLALAVAGGEGMVAALARVERGASGPLADELAEVLGQVREGRPLADALDALAARTPEPQLASFAAALATAVERGTPLAEVLHAQAADARERGRHALLEEGGRREIAMLVPVVLLILPVTVLFALYPSLAALRWGG